MFLDLTLGEIATLRIALASLSDQLQNDGLGDDEHGKELAIIYQKNVCSILRKILPTQVA